MTRYITLLLVLGLYQTSSAYLLSGTVTDEHGPVAFASVYVKSTTYGVVTNDKGRFFMQLENGHYQLIIEHVGYESTTLDVAITGEDKSISMLLQPAATELEELVVKGDREDPALEIIRRAIGNRDKNSDSIPVFGCDVYTKSSLEVEHSKPVDSLFQESGRLERVNFLEVHSRMFYEAPNTIREIRKSYRDLYNKKGSEGGGITISFEYDESWDNVAYRNPYIFGINLHEVRFNFYTDLVHLDALSDRPYVSPLSRTAFISYRYKYETTFAQNDQLIHKIRVIPRNRAGNLFTGWIYIVDGSYAIKAVDLELNRHSLRFFRYFKVIQSYMSLDQNKHVVERQEFYYNSPEGAKAVNIGNTLIQYSNYTINEYYPRKLMKGADIFYEDDALSKDSAYWDEVRPIRLKLIEREYIKEQDSIIRYHQTEQYLQDQDSIYNHMNIWNYLLNGVYHRYTDKKFSYFIDPLIAQLDPFGVGGYRHQFGFSLSKEWNNGNRLNTWQEINYGFMNSDIRGSVDASYTLLPKQFGSIRAGYENDYSFVNNYESILATFSRSNYVHKEAFRGGGRIELVNGLYGRVLTEYARYASIRDLTLARWSGEIFGDLNEPQDFEEYRDMVIDMELTYVIGQKYIMKPNKKEIIGKAYPELVLTYKKGLPGFLNSSVNYDFVELTFNHEFRVRNLGTSKYAIHTGQFLNDASVRVSNPKFFRGSDVLFFSDPLRSFQLLGPTVSTTRAYFQGQYIHHFNGVLLNKIPLVNRLRMTAVGGAGILAVADEFRHAEIYGGVAKVFRIKSQLFKVSAFYVVADSNLSDLAGGFKIGIDFYNTFTGSWSY